MTDTFRICSIPDSGGFADGNSAGLAWDILHRTATHRVPDILDLSACVHLKPYAIACLCGLAELAKNAGSSIQVIPPTNEGCYQHLSRLGLPTFFEGDWHTSLPRDSNICIHRVGWPPGNEGERIVEVLAPRTNLAPGIFPRMVEGLDEIILNALTHAASPVDCIVAGQAFPTTGKVELAVLDLGQTIKLHLTSNPKYMNVQDDESAILKALEEGVTGTPAGHRNSRGEQNSGAGLAFLREYCETGAGELTILSGNRWITCSESQSPVIGHFQGHFTGCLVNIRYYVDRNLESSNIVPIL